jgi:hypothetical protein
MSQSGFPTPSPVSETAVPLRVQATASMKSTAASNDTTFGAEVKES